MRVPTIDGPSVTTNERAGYSPRLRGPDTSLEEGLQSLGRGIEQVAVAAEGYVARADELRRTEALTQYQRDVNAELLGDSTTQGKVDAAFDGREAPTGFLNTNGTDASAKSAATLQRLEKRRQELGAELNDRQRVGFLQRSAAAYEGARARVESHVGQQFRAAQVATAEAAKQAALDSAATGGDSEAFKRQVADVEKSITALALSPEDAAADLKKFRGDVAVATIGAALANNDVDAAAKQLELDREALGTRYPQVKHQVDVARKGREQDIAQGEADKQVAAWADEVRDVDGFVSESALRAKAKGVPADKQRFFEHSLDRHVRNEAAKKEEAIRGARDVANRADVQSQQIPGATYDFLLKQDPDFLLARQARKRAEFRAWKAQKDGDARGKAAEAKLQKAVDQEFLNRLGAELVNNPGADPEEFLTTFIAEKAKEGDDVTVSDVARARAGLDAAKAGKKAETAEGATERAVASRLQVTLEKQARREAKGPVDQRKLNERVGAAMALYHAALERNGGKPLDEAQLSQLEQQMVSEVRVDRSLLPGTKSTGLLVDQPVYGPEAPAKPPASNATKPGTVTIRRKSDGKTRTVPAEGAARFLADPNFEQVD